MILRTGLLVSAAVHGGLVLGVLLALASPKLFESLPEQAIMVEVVTPEEARQVVAPQPEKPKTDDPSPPRQSAASQPAGLPAPQPLPEQPVEAAPRAFSMLDPAGMALFNIKLPEAAVDAPAATTAKLTQDEVAAFKQHLKKCWRLPSDLTASRTRVVLRVSLARDGALAAEPALVEGTASRDGPVIMQAAMAALEQCQPFAFLPAERYSEWKVLDVSFSPREMM